MKDVNIHIYALVLLMKFIGHWDCKTQDNEIQRESCFLGNIFFEKKLVAMQEIFTKEYEEENSFPKFAMPNSEITQPLECETRIFQC